MAGNRIDTVRDIGRAIPDPATTDPNPIGATADKGTSNEFSRSDHIHTIQYTPGLMPMLKQYLGDGTDFVVTGTDWTTKRAVAIPYNTIDGAWRLRFNIVGQFASGSDYHFLLTISGISFPAQVQAVSVYYRSLQNLTSDQFFNGRVNDTGMISVLFSSAWDFSGDDWAISGDVELATKPTWAD